MSDHLITAMASVFIAIVGVAVIAVLVAPSAKTSSVLTAGGGGFACALSTAISPVSGGLGGLIGNLGGGNCSNLTPNVTSTVTFGQPL